MIEEKKSAVKEQFNKDSNQYLSKHLTSEKIREKDRILNLVFDKIKYQKVLDIGCGPGTISEDLLEISEQVWGIDISEDMIKIATDRFNKTKFNTIIHFDVGDAENLKFPDQFFDAVFCIGVLRYLDSWENGLHEIYRVLKPNGIVVITFYYRFSPHWFSMYFLYRPLLPLISLFKRRSIRELIIKYKAEPLPISYKRFRKSLAIAGFKHLITQHSGFDLFPFNRLFPKLSRAIYLMAETALYDSNKLGWLGSICLVKGMKIENSND
jgi:demethylmenaquinone methyltransferase/2-methoxy-6-polyprenyl-1,4-benzoquinol methylase